MILTYNADIYLEVHARIYTNMYAHGHLVTVQMAAWVARGLDDMRAGMVRQGFTCPVPRAPVHCRWMGNPAASGCRRALFTIQEVRNAEWGYQVTWQWWNHVATSIDARGWRGVSQKWAPPPEGMRATVG